MQSWHISTAVTVGVFAGIIALSTLGAVEFAGFLTFSLLPSLVWFGWTLHARSLYRNEIMEQRVMEKLQGKLRTVDTSDISVKRGKISNG